MPPLIIVVDDEDGIRDVLSQWLVEEGYRVLPAHDGQAALDLVAAEPPDVIVSDVKMPKVNGLELVERLRDAGHEMPVVLITTWTTTEPLARPLPGVRFVTKPFDLDVISAVVAESLATA